MELSLSLYVLWLTFVLRVETKSWVLNSNVRSSSFSYTVRHTAAQRHVCACRVHTSYTSTDYFVSEMVYVHKHIKVNKRAVLASFHHPVKAQRSSWMGHWLLDLIKVQYIEENICPLLHCRLSTFTKAGKPCELALKPESRWRLMVVRKWQLKASELVCCSSSRRRLCFMSAPPNVLFSIVFFPFFVQTRCYVLFFQVFCFQGSVVFARLCIWQSSAASLDPPLLLLVNTNC